jgi:hypothetical protein
LICARCFSSFAGFLCSAHTWTTCAAMKTVLSLGGMCSQKSQNTHCTTLFNTTGHRMSHPAAYTCSGASALPSCPHPRLRDYVVIRAEGRNQWSAAASSWHEYGENEREGCTWTTVRLMLALEGPTRIVFGFFSQLFATSKTSRGIVALKSATCTKMPLCQTSRSVTWNS